MRGDTLLPLLFPMGNWLVPPHHHVLRAVGGAIVRRGLRHHSEGVHWAIAPFPTFAIATNFAAATGHVHVHVHVHVTLPSQDPAMADSVHLDRLRRLHTVPTTSATAAIAAAAHAAKGLHRGAQSRVHL